MSTENNSATSTTELDVSTAHQPAPGADDKKPLPATPDETVEAQQETPEQVEERRKQKEREHNQRRLQRRTTEAAEAKAEAKLLREERDRLRTQLEARQSQETGEPKRNGINPATGAEYTFEEYLEARADWRADQRVDTRLKTEREAQQGKEQQQRDTAGSEKVAKAWSERETSFQAANKDYETVVGPFVDEDLKSFSQQARMAILESEVGPALLFHLAKNPDDADRIADLSPVRQIAELGKLEAKVSMPAKKTTSAPAPASTTSGGRTASKDLSKMSQDEYEAHRKSNGARWAR